MTKQERFGGDWDAFVNAGQKRTIVVHIRDKGNRNPDALLKIVMKAHPKASREHVAQAIDHYLKLDPEMLDSEA